MRARNIGVRPKKYQFLEKGQNRNFGYKIVISVKNPNFILWISDDETDCTIVISSNSEIVGIYTFFEASRFECPKMIFDVMKVTYNTYLCAISGMSGESMKMDSRDSAECQNWKKKGHRCHF